MENEKRLEEGIVLSTNTRKRGTDEEHRGINVASDTLKENSCAMRERRGILCISSAEHPKEPKREDVEAPRL